MTCRIRAIITLTVLIIGALTYSENVALAQTPALTTKKAASSKCKRASFRVVLDVGHTAEDPGAMSSRGAKEYDFNLRLARQIEFKLLEAGFGRTVLQITGGQALAGLVRRVVTANSSNAGLFLSIHHDSVPDRFLEPWEFEGKELHYSDRFKGHSIFVSRENANFSSSLLFARLLGKQLKARGLQYTHHYTEIIMGDRRRELLDAKTGVYRFDKLYVLRASQMPAVLLEAGSIINRDEELILSTDERQLSIAESVLDAVDTFCASRSARALTTVSPPGRFSPKGPARNPLVSQPTP